MAWPDDPTYGDPGGALPPDLSTLQFPWSSPSPPPDPQLVPVQPGIGIPTSALDPAVPPAQVLGPPTGPPTDAQALSGAGQAFVSPPPASGPPIDLTPPAPVQPASPPLPFGPQPPTVAQLPGVSIATESRPSRATELAANPLAMRPGAESATGTGQLAPTPELTDEEAGKAIANLPPEQQAAIRGKLDAAKADNYATKLLEASTTNRIKAQQNADDYSKALAVAQQKQAELETDYKQLANAKVDPDRWWASRSSPQKIAGYLAAIVGGLVQSRAGGPNAGLQMIQQHIDQDVAAQQSELSNKRSILGARQSAVGEMFARTGDMYRSAETARAAAWEATIQGLQAEQLKYDQHGTTALRIADTITQARAQQAAATNAYGQQTLKNALEVTKENREGALAVSTISKNQADAAEALAKAGKLGAAGAGTGAGSPTNPAYTVATGWFNPFDPTQPIMGKRQIGGKGEDAKERNAVGAQIGTYGHVQDYWAKLAAIGERIGYAKSAGESVWKARRGTLESEYDAAKEALTVYLTKELGDKLTQGQLEAQAHRIPDRASVFEARDPSKQISAAQEDADRDFARDMNQVGINAEPILHAAQQRRMVVTPSATMELDAAHAAAAAAPEDKDAQRALVAAEQRQRDEVAAQQQRAADTKTVREMPPIPGPLPEEAGRPAAEVSAIREANRAVDKLAALQKRFWSAAGDTTYRKGLKPGDLAAADRSQDVKVGDLAHEVIQQRALVEQLRTQALGEVNTRTLTERARKLGISPEEALARARAGVPIGDETSAPAPEPIAPNPLAPNQSYLPGADPFAAPVNATSAPYPPPPVKPKKKGR